MISKKFNIIVGIFFLVLAIAYTSGIVYLNNSSTANISASSLNSGLVGHWMLDATHNMTDLTPNENHGTAQGGITVGGATDRHGQAGMATTFVSASSEYINTGDVSHLNGASKLSISAWMKRTTSSSLVILSKGVGTDNDIDMELWSDGNVYFEVGSGSNFYGFISEPGTDWYHFVMVFDGSETGNARLKGYVNGVLVSLSYSGTSPATTDDNTADFNIGRYDFGVTGYSDGSIADVRVYDRVLTATEITSLYDSYNPKVSAGSLQKGLVFDMPLTSRYTKTETAGSEIMTDRTPYSNDGTNNGATVGTGSTSFDGSSDYVDLGQPSEFTNLGASDFTISLWAKPVALSTGWTGFVYVGQVASSNGHLGFDSSNNLAGGTGDGSTWQTHQTSYALTTNWQYFVMKRESGRIYFYVDGDYNSDYAHAYTPTALDENAWIGKGTTTEHFNGNITGVRIYNRALSATEIKLLYDKGRRA